MSEELTRGVVLKRSLVNFTEVSSTQGIPQTGEAKRRVCVGFWLVAVAIATGLLIWQIVLLVEQYFQYAVNVQVELQFQQRVFPAVTVCDLNPYKQSVASQFSKVNRLMATYEYANEKLVCTLVGLCQVTANASLDADMEMYGLSAINNTGVLQRRVAALLGMETAPYDMNPAKATFDEMIRSCSFNTIPCDSSYWTPMQDLIMGNCFTFNLNSSLYAARSGPTFGLRLRLATNVSEYLSMVSASGLSILVHDQDQYPFSDSLGYVVQTGTSTMISVTYTVTSRLGSPYGTCSDSKPDFYLYNLSYSAEGCQRSAYQQSMVESCGCYDPSYPQPSDNSSVPCAVPDNLSCWVANAFNATDSCVQPCNEGSYTITMSQGKWPGGNTRLIPGCVEGMYNDTCLNTYTNNMAMVAVYFEQLNYQTTIESPADSVSSMLSNLGGQIGLWLGMSVMSIIEFVVLFAQLFLTCLSPQVGDYLRF